MDQPLNIHTNGIQVNGKDTYHNHRYEPTPYHVLEQLFTELPLTKKDILVDYGCGKGRLNFYVHHTFDCGTVGIEFSKEYYDDACTNLSNYIGGNTNRIQFHHILAQDYIVQSEETHFYFFNPFSIGIFAKTLSQILYSYQCQPRKMTLILYYPDTEYLYYLEFSTPFQKVKEIPVADYKKDDREYFCIYQLI